MSNDENKFQPIFQILHIKSAWFLLEMAMALGTTIGMRFLQMWDQWGTETEQKMKWKHNVLLNVLNLEEMVSQ